MGRQIKLLLLVSSPTSLKQALMLELSRNTPVLGEPGGQLIAHIARQNQQLKLVLGF
jgi:hypothetical protein